MKPGMVWLGLVLVAVEHAQQPGLILSCLAFFEWLSMRRQLLLSWLEAYHTYAPFLFMRGCRLQAVDANMINIFHDKMQERCCWPVLLRCTGRWRHAALGLLGGLLQAAGLTVRTACTRGAA